MRSAATGRHVVLVVLVVLLAIVAFVAGSTTPSLTVVPRTPGHPSVQPARSAGAAPGLGASGMCPPYCPSAHRSTASAVVYAVVLVAMLVVFLTGLWVLWMLLRSVWARRRSPAPGPSDESNPQPFPAVADQDQVAEALDTGLGALDTGLVDLADTSGDPRRAVIACWVRMEQAAEQAGVQRLAGDAPADLVSRLLNAYQVDGVVLDAFAEVYRTARYATHTVDETMRAAAVSALRQVRDALRERRASDPGHATAGHATDADAVVER